VENTNRGDKTLTKKDIIANTLAEQIEGGQILRGERLAGEHTLASQFQVSRGTVRQALSELQRRHLIATRGGVGSVVIYDGQTLDHQAGWTAALSNISRRITVCLLRIEKVARADVPDLPDTVPGGEFVLVVRRRDAAQEDGSAKTVSLERSYVPNVGILAALPQRGLTDDSLTATLSRAGLTASHGDQSVALRFLTADDAAAMNRTAGEPFLRTVRTSFTPNGRFVEHVVSVLDPAHFTVSSRFGMTP
jgi:GntR family transcriptional regulator